MPFILAVMDPPSVNSFAGEMAVAYFMAHLPQGPVPLLNGGELAVLYCFIYLFFATNGPGRFSLDAMMGRNRSDARDANLAREGVH